MAQIITGQSGAFKYAGHINKETDTLGTFLYRYMNEA